MKRYRIDDGKMIPDPYGEWVAWEDARREISHWKDARNTAVTGGEILVEQRNVISKQNEELRREIEQLKARIVEPTENGKVYCGSCQQVHEDCCPYLGD